jgi:hypothetical protein
VQGGGGAESGKPKTLPPEFFTLKLIQQKVPVGQIAGTPGIPKRENMGGHRGKSGNAVKPHNTGILGAAPCRSNHLPAKDLQIQAGE